MPQWMDVAIGTLTIISLLMVIWSKGIRPMMKAIGELLDAKEITADNNRMITSHLKESHSMWERTDRRLDRIEKKIDQNGH